MRGSPPTQRVLHVFDLLASRPTERLTNAEIAAALGLSPSTTLGLVNEMTDFGYLVRHSNRTYSLGGRAITLGVAARESRPALASSRPVLDGLSADMACICTASSVVGDEIVVLEIADAGGQGAPIVRPGTRFPFLAPVGVMFAAWSADDVVERWLSRAPVGLDDAKRQRTREVIDSCRRDGWLVERLTDAELLLHQSLPLFARGREGDEVRLAINQALAVFGARDYLTSELSDEIPLSVSFVCAPSFDAEGKVELIIGAYVMRSGLDATEVSEMAQRVRQAGEVVTASVGGHDPWR